MSKIYIAVTSKWFPPILALVQTMRHVGMIAFAYGDAVHYEKSVDLWAYIRKDLARPLFEPFEFCAIEHPWGIVGLFCRDFEPILGGECTAVRARERLQVEGWDGVLCWHWRIISRAGKVV